MSAAQEAQEGHSPMCCGHAGGGAGSSDITVRLGTRSGRQIKLSPDLNHISVWCVEFAVDFGNAALQCPGADAAPATARDASSSSGAGKQRHERGVALLTAAVLVCVLGHATAF